jgi:hypothetical protein
MSLKKQMFEAEIKKLNLPAAMESVIEELHDVAFQEDNDEPQYIEKDWKSVDKDNGDGTSSVETT